MKHSLQRIQMASSVPLLTPYNFPTWKSKMEIQLFSKGLYRVAMDTEVDPRSAIEKSRFLNKKDEAFGFLCLSISRDLLFHLTDLKTRKGIWDKLNLYMESMMTWGFTSLKMNSRLSNLPISRLWMNYLQSSSILFFSWSNAKWRRKMISSS